MPIIHKQFGNTWKGNRWDWNKTTEKGVSLEEWELFEGTLSNLIGISKGIKSGEIKSSDILDKSPLMRVPMLKSAKIRTQNVHKLKCDCKIGNCKLRQTMLGIEECMDTVINFLIKEGFPGDYE